MFAWDAAATLNLRFASFLMFLVGNNQVLASAALTSYCVANHWYTKGKYLKVMSVYSAISEVPSYGLELAALMSLNAFVWIVVVPSLVMRKAMSLAFVTFVTSTAATTGPLCSERHTAIHLRKSSKNPNAEVCIASGACLRTMFSHDVSKPVHKARIFKCKAVVDPTESSNGFDINGALLVIFDV